MLISCAFEGDICSVQLKFRSMVFTPSFHIALSLIYFTASITQEQTQTLGLPLNANAAF